LNLGDKREDGHDRIDHRFAEGGNREVQGAVEGFVKLLLIFPLTFLLHPFNLPSIFLPKDVVRAYKSLLKEKEALDVSIAALTLDDKSKEPGTSEGSGDDTKKQLNTIMSSLATLSAEKSRMEASFLANKKALTSDIEAKNKEIASLGEKLKKAMMELKMRDQERENFKAKMTSFERILNDERHLKESLETQLNQLKTAFSQTSNSDKVIKDLTQELSDAKKKIRSFENSDSKFRDDSSVLQALKSEMESLKQQHITNLTMEKQRANEANEKSKKLTALHEERVQSLEARLSELSASVAHYHNLRESDQQNILQLKDKISLLSQNSDELPQPERQRFPSVHAIIDEIEKLKHILIVENTKLEHPIDLSSVLARRFSGGDEVTVPAEKYTNLRQDFNKIKAENEVLKLQTKDQGEHIKTLQEKVQVLNSNIDSLETDLKNKSLEVNNELRAERSKNRDAVNAMEGEHRTKVSQLEQQLQKQRERSLTLLEEKENEIRTLKTSYELFMPKKASISQYEDDDGQYSESSSSRRKTSTSYHLGTVLNQPNTSGNLPETHMIYYSNELARKEMELSSIRKAKREAESLIRQTLKEKIMMQETMDDRIALLEQQVDR
jgi:GRIP and coiled-coil domain-containing protein 1